MEGCKDHCIPVVGHQYPGKPYGASIAHVPSESVQEFSRSGVPADQGSQITQPSPVRFHIVQ